MTHRDDLFDRWREQVLSGRSQRYVPELDLAFWEQKAADYDASLPALPRTVAWLREQLAGRESLLEVGAGTGRLLLPLADTVPHVTALDYSPDMLAQLRRKQPPAHLQTLCQPLETALSDPLFPPHDVVLSAWSLAYQPDLRATLEGLLRLARRDLYLLEDDGVGSPHVSLRRQLTGQPRPRRATLLREAATALGWTFSAYTISEERELTLPDTAALLALARLPLPENEVLSALRPHLTPLGDGWRYHWTFDVHVLHVEVS